MRRLLFPLAAAAIALGGPATAAIASPAHPVLASHGCTKTSTHKCIRGGEFCPQAKYGKRGRDAKGRVYVCKGSKTQPHWEIP